MKYTTTKGDTWDSADCAQALHDSVMALSQAGDKKTGPKMLADMIDTLMAHAAAGRLTPAGGDGSGADDVETADVAAPLLGADRSKKQDSFEARRRAGGDHHGSNGAGRSSSADAVDRMYDRLASSKAKH